MVPTLIEIKASNKQIYRKTGAVPRSEFTQALNQLAEWRTWFEASGNRQVFIDDYGVPGLFTGHAMKLDLFLVYGRHSEFDGDRARSQHRASLLPSSDEDLMSFDRLEPEEGLQLVMTVRALGNGRFRAVAIPPTFMLGPHIAEDLPPIDGVTEAISQSAWITPSRKQFLRQRLAYWMDWARARSTKKGLGLMGPNPWE
jgi:hypothetical protein